MHNRQAFAEFSPDLNVELVTELDLQAVYNAMIKLGQDFTIPELAERVTAQGGLALVRDIKTAHIRYAVDKDFTNEKVKKYANVVEKLGRLHHIRSLLKAAAETLDEDQKSLANVDDETLVSKVVNELVDIQYNRATQKGFRTYDYFLNEYKKRLRKILKGETSEERIPTGFRTFDISTGGGLPIGLTVIGGLPGSGKTQWGWQATINLAKYLRDNHIDGVCAVNSVEMSGEALASRGVLSGAEIDSVELRKGTYHNDEAALRRIIEELSAQKALPIFIDDSDFLSSQMIASRVSGLRARFKNVKLVLIDFAEIVSDKGDNQEQRVASVFVNAKALAKRLNCPVILLSQLSRQVDQTGTRVPNIRHLRYSGMAEAISDMILLIYNPNYYMKSGVKLTPHPQMPPVDNVAYIIVGKHRDGATGFLPMQWIAEYTKWGDLGDNSNLKSYDDEE